MNYNGTTNRTTTHYLGWTTVNTVFAFACLATSSAWAIVAIPICPGDELSRAYSLTVNSVRVPVGSSEFNGGKTFHVASFESDTPAVARIKIHNRTQHVRVRPARERHKVRYDKGMLEFNVDSGEKLVIETDDAPPMFLFSIPVERVKPKPGDRGIVYFGPGEHSAGEIRLKSGQTLYLEAGARVRGRVYAFEAHDVAIRGRGVLDARGYTNRDKKIHGVLFERCKNVSVEGIQIRTGDWWQVLMLLTDHVRVDHLHTLSFGVNNDGVDTDGVSDMRVRDSFIGCGDDGFGIHAVDAVSFGEPVTSSFLAERCVIWNEHAGNGLRVGASTETGEIRDIVFRSVDVLRCANNAIMIDHSDWATLRRIVFDDFHNDTSKPLANIAILKTHYSNDTGFRNERGRIEGLLFRKVTSAGGGISIRGFDQDHAVRGVCLIDCQIKGKRIDAVNSLAINEYVYDVTFNEEPAAEVVATELPPTSEVNEVILDNDSEGSWAFARDLETIPSEYSYGGSTWRLKRLGRGHGAVYAPRLEGTYEISVYWGDHQGLSAVAPWTVFHKHGYTTQLLDQNRSTGWHQLGEFELTAESWVRLVDPHYPVSNGPVVADAVRFRRVASPRRNAEGH